MVRQQSLWPSALGAAAGLAGGLGIDAVLGDPRRGHPVAAFGNVAAAAERAVHRDSRPVGAAYAGTLMLPGRTLLAFGALYPGALDHGGVWGGGWRLVASGFLHFSPIHLLFNMLCLVSWGMSDVSLERGHRAG